MNSTYITPDKWIYEFLTNPFHVYTTDSNGNKNGINAYAFEEIPGLDEIDLPSAIFSPAFEVTTPVMDALIKEAEVFDIDIRALSSKDAIDIRNLAMDALNDELFNEQRVLDYAQSTYTELLELDKIGETPIYNANFRVSIRF